MVFLYKYGISQSIPTSSATVGNRELPIYCVETKEPKIALTFDAAWGNEDTNQIMEILRKHDVKVTFFICRFFTLNILFCEQEA